MKTLKEMREEKGITQVEMAQKLKISYQAYRFYEAGYRKTMKEELQSKISEILKINFVYVPNIDKVDIITEYANNYKNDNREKINQYAKEYYRKNKGC